MGYNSFVWPGDAMKLDELQARAMELSQRALAA
jgi:hypothetical protein